MEVHVENIAMSHARFSTSISRAPVGNIVLVKFASDIILRSGEYLSVSEEVSPKFELATSSVVKVAVEPVKPSELPSLVKGLSEL